MEAASRDYLGILSVSADSNEHFEGQVFIMKDAMLNVKKSTWRLTPKQ